MRNSRLSDKCLNGLPTSAAVSFAPNPRGEQKLVAAVVNVCLEASYDVLISSLFVSVTLKRRRRDSILK
jgi:hypothetical protein